MTVSQLIELLSRCRGDAELFVGHIKGGTLEPLADFYNESEIDREGNKTRGRKVPVLYVNEDVKHEW